MTTEQAGNPEWKRKNGHLVREYALSSGIHRRELKTMIAGTNIGVTVTDKADVDMRNVNFTSLTQRPIGDRHLILQDIERGSVNAVVATNNSLEIHVADKEEAVKYFPTKALVIFSYDENSHLKWCRLQPEALSTSREKPISFRDALPTLINLIKTEDMKELSLHKQTQEDEYEGLLGRFSEETKMIMVPKLDQTKKQLMDALLESVPADDREVYLSLLQSIGLDYVIKNDLIISIDEEADDISALDIKNFLDVLVYVEIMTFSHPNYQQNFVSLSQFSEDSFQYQELEVETYADNPTEKKEKSSEQQESSYGKLMNYQGNNFIVQKDKDFIFVTCTPRRSKSWTVRFPLTLPVNNIIDTIDDLDADFRKVKDLMPISLKTKS